MTPAAVKQAELLPADEPSASQGLGPVAASSSNVVSMFERLASNPDASVEKIERLMALWERGEAQKAAALFNAAMARAQRVMRPVATDAYNPSTKSKYASYEALDRVLRPIYTEHGFGLSFNTGESPLSEHVRVLCYATHDGGYSREYHVDMPADGKGAKGGDVMTKTHAVGSALSYGMRYLLKMIFNVAVGEDDDDGRKASGKPDLVVPAGFEEWWHDMQAVADEGFGPFSAGWNNSKPEHRAHAMATNKDGLTALKVTAKAVDAKAQASKVSA